MLRAGAFVVPRGDAGTNFIIGELGVLAPEALFEQLTRKVGEVQRRAKSLGSFGEVSTHT